MNTGVGAESDERSDDPAIESARDMELLCAGLLALASLAERASDYRNARRAFEHELRVLTDDLYERADRLRAREFVRSLAQSRPPLARRTLEHLVKWGTKMGAQPV